MPLDEQDKQWIAETLAETLDSKLYAMETKLLRAFADYNVSAGIRFRKLEADVSNVDASSQPRHPRRDAYALLQKATHRAAAARVAVAYRAAILNPTPNCQSCE